MYEPVRAAPAARSRRRRPGRLLAALVFASLTLGGTMTEAQATTPDRFLMGVERIGVRCFVTADVAGVDALQVERHLCDAALAAVRERAGAGRPAVALDIVDPRLDEPGTLAVLLHGHLQESGRIVPETEGALLALSLDLFRNITAPVAGNLFPAPPETVFYPQPGTPETWRGEPGEALSAALGRMIDAALGHQPAAGG